MEKFTASNGWELRSNGAIYSSDKVAYPYPLIGKDAVKALRDLFLHERDQELGRWRWPENPDYVVYRTGENLACAVNERTREMLEQPRDLVRLRESLERTRGDLHGALAAYFAAHPEPKHWHDAKPGEVWVVRWPDADEDEEGLVVPSNGWPRAWECVTAARRIWPEVSDE